MEVLKVDAVVRLVVRRWVGMVGVEDLEEFSDLFWVVVRLYYLFSEEKLCSEFLRDVVYLVVFRVFSFRDDYRFGEF